MLSILKKASSNVRWLFYVKKAQKIGKDMELDRFSVFKK
jgi:hypothetical protein